MKSKQWSAMLLCCAAAIGCGAEDATLGSGNFPGTNNLSDAGSDTGATAVPGTMGGTPSGGSVGGGLDASPGGPVTPVQEGPCEQKVASAGPVVPDMMIVLDRSGSMAPQFPPDLDCTGNDFIASFTQCPLLGVDCAADQWKDVTVCGGTQPPPGIDRWTPAVNGIKSLTSSLDSKVSFGLTLFPSTNGDSCSAGREVVPVSLMSSGAIGQALDQTRPGGATPTSATLQAVLQGIKNRPINPDVGTPPQYVLLVTDGQPTCPNGNGSGSGNAGEQDKKLTLDALDALTAAGVKTYVIGYDASVDPKLAAVLTEFAQHGGTGDFYPVQDEQSLVTQLSAITDTVAECSYQLDKEPVDPTYVRVELDGVKLDLQNADGWSITGKNVTIQGGACTKLQDGANHRLIVTVECVKQILL